MTGYGRGAAERDGRRVAVEMRSVNHRFLDVKIRGSAIPPSAEEALKKRIKAVCQRGVIHVSIRVERRASAGAIRADVDLAKQVRGTLAGLARELGFMREAVSLEFVCQQPGVLSMVEPVADSADEASTGACVDEAGAQALASLVAMRATEGHALAEELTGRIDNLRALTDRIAGCAEGAPERLQERLHARLDRLLQTRGLELDKERLAHEVAVLADRLDITEELVRLRGHFEHMLGMMDEARAQTVAVGRRLEFLGQEMGREVNTIGSKSQSADIARAVVEAKSELEKIREQVQNIE